MPQITSRTLELQRKVSMHFHNKFANTDHLVLTPQEIALFIEQQIEEYATQAKQRRHRNAPAHVKQIAEADFTGARRAVYDWLHAAGREGITGTEVASLAGLERYTALPRLTELGRMGYAVDSGATRANPATGKPQIVWVHRDYFTKESK